MTTWLADVLRDAGLEVTEHGVRPRPGEYAPRGVLNHHTAGKPTVGDPSPTLGLVKAGRYRLGKLDLAGPLCQLLIGYDGHCHVITTGRANHAGEARASGPMPAGDGNELYIGVEIDYSGYAEPSPMQYAAAVRANAAILTRMRRSASSARGHRETSTTGKWDPGQVDLDRFRSDVTTVMTAMAARPAPQPLNPQEDDDMLIIKIGRSRYRAVAGDRFIPLERPFAEAAILAGVRAVAVGSEADVQHLADLLRSEAPEVVAAVDAKAGA